MKKLFSILLVVALVLSFGTVSAFAAYQPEGANYVDADNDGVCDNCPVGGVRPLDGSGKQARHGGTARGAGFVDADGDGVCDIGLNEGGCRQNGNGAQRGRNK